MLPTRGVATLMGKLKLPAESVIVCTPGCVGCAGCPAMVTICDVTLLGVVMVFGTLTTWMTSGLEFSTATIAGCPSGMMATSLGIVVTETTEGVVVADWCCTSTTEDIGHRGVQGQHGCVAVLEALLQL